jgi:hypothetical protein
MRRFATVLFSAALILCLVPAAFAQKTKTVVLIVSDGLRWQEVFTGADPLLLDPKNGGSWMEEDALKAKFWRDDAEERRRILFPFIWGTVAKHGQIFGNQHKGHQRTRFFLSRLQRDVGGFSRSQDRPQ